MNRPKFYAIDFAEVEARVVAWLDEAGTINVEQWDRLTGTRKKGMFTKQHYLAVASILRSVRDDVRASEMPADARQEQINILNETTMRFVRLFKNDSPKFRDLVFIGEACAGDQPDAGQE